MTQEQLNTLLKTTGLPVVYHSWPPGEAPALPYIVFLAVRSNNFKADGVVYQKITHYQVELYSAEKDPASEQLVEDALYAAGIPWEKSETFIESEGFFEILYEIEV